MISPVGVKSAVGAGRRSECRREWQGIEDGFLVNSVVLCYTIGVMKISKVIYTLCTIATLGVCGLSYQARAVTDESDTTVQKGKEGDAEAELPKVPAALKEKEFLLPAKLNTKAKVYFIYQSRSACGICVAEAPAIVKIYKSMHGKGAELVMLNIDSDKEAAVRWAKAEKMKFPIVPPGASSGIPFPYTGEGLLPCMVALDANGNKLGEANARGVAEFLKGWKKMVREVEKAAKAAEAEKKKAEAAESE